MTNVVLKTDATQSVRCDGMEISLNIKCEGLSMQASLRKLQESADQLLFALQNIGIDPSSFMMDYLNSDSLTGDGKQRTKLHLLTRCNADLELLKKFWSKLAQLPFAVEFNICFFYENEGCDLQKLQKEALGKAREEASQMAELLGANAPECVSLDFKTSANHSANLTPILTCEPAYVVEGPIPSMIQNLQIPLLTLKASANTTWSF